MRPQIKLVTGKGGVGKSTVAMALGKSIADSGQSCLVVELDGPNDLEDIVGLKLGMKGQQISNNLWAAHWQSIDCLKELITHFIKSDMLSELFFKAPFMKDFLAIAPGLKELALMGKLTSAARNYGPQMDFDVIVVDAYSTGHLLALLDAPEGMGKSFKRGPMGEQSRAILEVLRNHELCEFIVVNLFEDLVVEESIDFYNELLRRGYKVSIVNNKHLNLEMLELQKHKGDFVQMLSAKQELQLKIIEQLKSIKTVSIPLLSSPPDKLYKELSKEFSL